MMDPKSIAWIAWETQRRSLNLSKRLGAELFIFDDERSGRSRYFLSIAKTLRVFFRYRGRTVVVQNPSMLLAAMACFLRPLFRYKLVVDRHSAYMDAVRNSPLSTRIMRLISIYTLRTADLTIVTNPQLLKKVVRCGGRGYVLPDPYPEMDAEAPRKKNSPFEVLLVSSWAPDEPIAEMIEASRALGPAFRVLASGKPKARFSQLIARKPENFITTGFIPDDQYFDLMRRVDCVAALTTRGATLVCGAYEAVSLGKPLILGNSRVLKAYFNRGAVYTDSSPADLADKVREMAACYDENLRDILIFREKSRSDWESKFAGLIHCIQSITRGK